LVLVVKAQNQAERLNGQKEKLEKCEKVI